MDDPGRIILGNNFKLDGSEQLMASLSGGPGPRVTGMVARVSSTAQATMIRPRYLVLAGSDSEDNLNSKLTTLIRNPGSWACHTGTADSES